MRTTKDVIWVARSSWGKSMIHIRIQREKKVESDEIAVIKRRKKKQEVKSQPNVASSVSHRAAHSVYNVQSER